MKKYIAFLLCLIMILSLFSCGKENICQDTNKQDQNENTENASNNVSNNTTVEKYRSIVEIYRLIVEKFSVVNQNPLAVAAELGIQDESEKESFLRLYSSIHQFYPGRGQEDSLSPHYKLGCGYAIKDLNGDGVDELVLLTDEYRIIAVYSLINDVPTLLGSYIKKDLGWSFRNWIDVEGRVHVVKTDGLDLYHHSISEISNGHLIELCTYGYDVFSENGVIVGKLYQTLHDNTVFITEQEVTEFNRQYGNPLNAGEAGNITMVSAKLTFTSLYTESEIAMGMYEAVLRNECMVYETDIEEYNYLGDCKTPYNRIPLSDCERLKYAYTDMDNNGVNELVIDCGDTLILRYYEGTVYAYSFTFRNLYYLNTDGSYSWNHTGENFEYGEEQIYFEGAELKTRELYRIVNDGEPNAEYYVEGKQVTQEELQKYIKDNPKTKIEFSEFDLTLSEEEAWRLANEYWDNQDGRKESAAGTVFTARIVLIDTPNPETNCYRFAFQVEWASNIRDDEEGDVPYHINLHDEILVNAFTGEITPSSYTPGGKALSVEDAIEVVKNKFFEEETHKEDNYCFEYAVNAITPDHIYEITIQKVMDQYAVFYTSEWVDKYSGEIIQGYYLFGKG